MDEEGKRKKDIDSLPGCSYYVNSAEHGYCYWNLVSSPDGKIDPFTDKEICDLLMLTPSQIDKIANSGMTKLRSIKDTPEMQEFRELIIEKINADADNTVYLPDEFNSVVAAQNNAEAQEEGLEDIINSGKKKREKVQLYGLYSQKTLERIKMEKDGNKTQKTNKKK